MMISCKKATELSSAALDRELTLIETARYWVHIGLCVPCRGFRSQLAAICTLVREDSDADGNVALSSDERARIQRFLDETGSGKKLGER